MKGTFKVAEIIDEGPLGLALSGTILSGQLRSGMEAQHITTVVIIRELVTVGEGKLLKRARIGQTIIVRPLPMVYELMKSLEGEVLEFSEERTETVKSGFVLNPDPTM